MATIAKPQAYALWSSSVGKKILMAVSGLILYGFVIVHMLGNLKVYQGREAFNHYAEGLRTFGAPFFGRGQLLWILRLALLAALIVHLVAVFQLVRQSRAARRHSYKKFDGLEFSFASRTMLWGGLLLLAYVVYHLMHLTFGNVHPNFIPGDAYNNFVVGFQQWPASLAYIVAMIPLGLHLYHGFWSMLQTLGANNPKYNRMRRPIALTLSALIVLLNISFPVAVLLGWVTL
ncbi:MAG TPA: succinate dehydrogenase cytochrome b subunit [Longimicrobiales bacterium]